MRTALIIGAAVFLAGCSSSSGSQGREQIKYGAPAADIAKELGICSRPQQVSHDSVRCKFPDGQIIAVSSIAGPADQQLELPAARSGYFCSLIGHGFDITGTAYTELANHVHLNAIVAKYGGRFGGGGC